MCSPATQRTYTAKEAARITGADYHNILYWLRSGLIGCSGSPDREIKQRHRALFGFTDLLEIAVIQQLQRRGAPTKRIRKALDTLKGCGPEYVSLFHLGAALPPELRKKAVYLDVTEDDIIIHEGKNRAISAVKHRCQMIIVHTLMVDFKRIKRDLEERLVAGVVSGN